MTKVFAASTALALVLAAPLTAQTANEMNSFAYAPQGDEIRASNFLGARVYTSEAEMEGDTAWNGSTDGFQDVGEINDVLMSADGEIEAILVDVGGFLGIGEKQVAVSMDELNLVTEGDDVDDWFVVFTSTRQALENAPEFEAEPRAGLDVDGANVTAKPDRANGSAAVMSEGTEMSEAATDDAAWEQADADRADEAMEQTEVEMAADNAMEEAGDAADAAATGIAGAAQTAGEEIDQAADATGEAMNNAADEVAEAADEAMPDADEGYAEIAVAELTKEELSGARVYDLNDKWIGEVHEVAMTAEGTPNAAILDVGGFLGIGEKRVEVPLDTLKAEKLTGGDEVRVFVDTTKDELTAMPEYDG